MPDTGSDLTLIQTWWKKNLDKLSRLIANLCDSLEETVIATLRIAMQIKSVPCNNIRELPVALEEISNKANIDKYITEKEKNYEPTAQKGWWWKDCLSVCDRMLMYGERVVIPGALQKRILKDFHTGHPSISRTKVLMTIVLAEYGGKKREKNKCKIMQWLCGGGNVEIYPLTKDGQILSNKH